MTARRSTTGPRAVRSGVLIAFMALCSILLTSCTVEPQVTASWPTQEAFEFVLSPQTLDFGDVPVGESATADVVLQNTGEAEVLLADLDLDLGHDLRWLGTTSFAVPPGSSSAITLRWTPERSGMVNRALALTLGPNPSELSEVVVPVVGTGVGPTMSVNISDFDFETVPLGCSALVKFTVTNSGNRDLVVDSVALRGDADFEVSLDQPAPWVVPPFQSREVVVRYAPTRVQPAGALLQLESNGGSARAGVSGMGAANDEHVIEVQQRSLRSYTTALVHVNRDLIPGVGWMPYAARFDAALPTLFERLQESGVAYRIAFVWDRSGTVTGGYIDNSMSVAAATRAAIDMLVAGLGTDNDQSLATLENAYTKNEEWLHEDLNWETSQLHLIGMNRDDERPADTAANHVVRAVSFQGSEELVVYHAIGGPPGGCAPYAQDFRLFVEAVKLTGGTFSSVCETDWRGAMEKLAAAMHGGAISFHGAAAVGLEGVPLVDSIRIEIDGQKMPGGWRYEPEPNAVVFERDYALPEGVMVLSYRSSSACRI